MPPYLACLKKNILVECTMGIALFKTCICGLLALSQIGIPQVSILSKPVTHPPFASNKLFEWATFDTKCKQEEVMSTRPTDHKKVQPQKSSTLTSP